MELVKLNLQKFKVLNNFTMGLGPRVNVLRGPAGSGKSTSFQALMLFKHLVLGYYRDFFSETQSMPEDFGTEERPLLQFEAVFRDDDRFVSWAGHWHTQSRYTAFERVQEGSALESMNDVFVYRNQKLMVVEGSQIVQRDLEGAAFRSSVMDSFKNPECQSCMTIRKKLKAWANNIILLDALDPGKLAAVGSKCRSFETHGACFSGFLAGLSRNRLKRVEARMKRFFPNAEGLRPVSLPGKLFTIEYRENGMGWHLDRLSSGQLRLLALAAIPELPASLVLLEDLESGIGSRFTTQVFENFAQCPFQILATSYGSTELPGVNVIQFPGFPQSIVA